MNPHLIFNSDRKKHKSKPLMAPRFAKISNRQNPSISYKPISKRIKQSKIFSLSNKKKRLLNNDDLVFKVQDKSVTPEPEPQLKKSIMKPPPELIKLYNSNKETNETVDDSPPHPQPLRRSTRKRFPRFLLDDC